MVILSANIYSKNKFCKLAFNKKDDMDNYAIIADNGGSDLQYRDIVGEVYTFPTMYAGILIPGTKFVYQRCGLSSMKVQEPDKERLSDDPHYFGIAEIGRVKDVGGGRYEAEIINYKKFVKAVPFRLKDGSHFEVASGQFWRNGVRQSRKEVYDEILLASTGIIPETSPLADLLPAPKPKKPVVTKRTNIRTVASNRSSVQVKDELRVSLISPSFHDDCYEVVTNIDGYWLHSIVDNKYFKIASLHNIRYNDGTLKIGRFLESKDPYILSDTKFSVIHSLGVSEKHVIGTIDFSSSEINFHDQRTSEKTVDIIRIPLVAAI